MDDADNLIPLDPAYKSLLRLQLAFAAVILLVAATIAEIAIPGWTGAVWLPALLVIASVGEGPAELRCTAQWTAPVVDEQDTGQGCACSTASRPARRPGLWSALLALLTGWCRGRRKRSR